MTQNRICPYPGLRAFNENESLYFKGREFHVEKSIELLRQNKFLMLTGASGDGKSSMVFAGMVPNARAGFFRGEFGKWAIADFRPERDPVDNFANSLATILNIESQKIKEQLNSGFSSLIDLYTHSSLFIDKKSAEFLNEDEKGQKKLINKSSNLLIIIDQFEELFTNPENFFNGQLSNNAKLLFNLIIETNRIAKEKEIPIYIVCTMRSDYIGNCTVYKGLPELIGTSNYFIPRLNRNEIYQAIEEPALLSGNNISARLVERLLYDLKEGLDILPVLQHALFRIWKEYEKDGSEKMDLIHYAKVAGMPSNELSDYDKKLFDEWFVKLPDFKKKLLTKPSLENVLNAHANELYETAHEKFNSNNSSKISKELSQEIIKASFKCLTRLDDNKAVRNRMSLSEIAKIIGNENITVEIISEILKIYASPKNSLIRTFGTNDSSKSQNEWLLDITHEALIRNWINLNLWVKEEVESVETFIDFKTQIDRWKQNNESKEFLLSAGQFSYYNEWFVNQKPNIYWFERYLKQITYTQKKDLKNDYLIDAKIIQNNIKIIFNDSLKQINRKRRLSKIAFVVISVLLVVSVFAFINSEIQKNKAIEMKKIAKANEIASRALMEKDKDPTLSYRLAEEGYKLYPTLLTKQALVETSYGNPFYNLLKGHTFKVNNVNYSHDGKKLVSASEDKNVIVWDQSGNIIKIIKGHKERVMTAKFNKSDSLILTSSCDKTCALWDLNGNKKVEFIGHNKKVNNAIFSDDEDFILTCSDDSTARIWSIDGTLIKTIFHKGCVFDAKFIKNDKIITTTNDNKITIWEINGKEFLKLNAPSYEKQIAVFIPSKDLIACNGYNNTIQLYNLSGNKVKELNNIYTYIISSAIVEESSLLLFGMNNGSILIWNYETNEVITSNDIHLPITDIKYSKEKKYFVATVESNKAYIFDLNGKLLFTIKPPDLIYSVAFSPDGNNLLLAHNPNITITYLNIRKSILYGNHDYIWDCDFSPKGEYLASACYDYTSCIWDSSGNLIHKLIGHSNKLRDVEFSSNGKYILTASFDKTARLWSIDGSCKSVLNHQAEVNAAIFSNNCEFIATACFDGKIGLWTGTGKLIKYLEKHTGPVMSIAFSPDNKYIVSGSSDKSIILWNIKGDFISQFSNNDEALYRVKFSDDSKYIYTGGNGGIATVFDIKGNEQTKLISNNGIISSIDFTSDNKYIATTDEQTAKLWDNKGNCLITFTNFTAYVNKIYFSKNNNYLLTSSDDGSVIVWDTGGNIITYYKTNTNIQDARFSPDEKQILMVGGNGFVRLVPAFIDNNYIQEIEKERGLFRQLTEQDKINYGIIENND